MQKVTAKSQKNLAVDVKIMYVKYKNITVDVIIYFVESVNYFV
jgi:hypothetical protein